MMENIPERENNNVILTSFAGWINSANSTDEIIEFLIFFSPNDFFHSTINSVQI